MTTSELIKATNLTLTWQLKLMISVHSQLPIPNLITILWSGPCPKPRQWWVRELVPWRWFARENKKETKNIVAERYWRIEICLDKSDSCHLVWGPMVMVGVFQPWAKTPHFCHASFVYIRTVLPQTPNSKKQEQEIPRLPTSVWAGFNSIDLAKLVAPLGT